jgi:hypothetical protein
MSAGATCEVNSALWLIDQDDAENCCSDRIAGHTVYATSALDTLQHTTLARPPQPVQIHFSGDSRTIEGFVAGQSHRVHWQQQGERQRCVFPDTGVLEVDYAEAFARTLGFTDRSAAREVLLGPGLLLLLAARGVFAVHASALQVGNRAVLLPAPSGSGKSSLARHAAAAGVVALTDDIAPIDVARGVLCPRFPQLKWPEPLAVADCEVPLHAFVFVTRGTAALSLEPMRAGDARTLLIRDTVAARLFPARLLAQHLAAVSDLALQVPAYQLHWPECDPAHLPAQCADAIARIAQL